MPLSKARDKERKKQSRLDKRVVRPSVQPKAPKQWLDADGHPVYDDCLIMDIDVDKFPINEP